MRTDKNEKQSAHGTAITPIREKPDQIGRSWVVSIFPSLLRRIEGDANPADVIQQSRIVYVVQQRKIHLPREEQIINSVFDCQQFRQPERFRFDAQIDIRTKAVRSHGSGTVKNYPTDWWVIAKYSANLFIACSGRPVSVMRM